VKRRPYHLTWLSRQYRNFNGLRTVELLRAVLRRVGVTMDDEARTTPTESGDTKTRKVLRKILEELRTLREERAIRPVLAYLPSVVELKGADPQGWMEFMKAEAKTLGIPMIDVLNAFRQLPVHEAVRLFIPQGLATPDHLTDEGNALVAKVIYEHLKSHPSTAELLLPDE
jgi:hypothetical protein